MNKNLVFNLHIPTKLLFGCGELRRLATEKLPGKKALIVISGGTSMKKYGYLDKVVGYLKENNVESVVFDKILPNPIKQHVMEAAALCRDEKCDFVIGLGGGSSIDSAKSIAIMACNEGDYWDYIAEVQARTSPLRRLCLLLPSQQRPAQAQRLTLGLLLPMRQLTKRLALAAS